jgi:release factor glutamine methyltransferase
MQDNPLPAVWTILSLLHWSTEHLQKKGFDSARLQIELLLSHALRMNRVQLYTNFEKPVSPEELASYKQLLQRKLKNEPVQYILGETEFYGMKFFVDKRVLIPRPETELLVEEVVTLSKSFSERNVPTILDIGTGSGNISIILAKHIPQATIVAVDCSQDALDVAHKNAEYHSLGSRIHFFEQNIFHSMNDTPLQQYAFDIVVSNPPYIALAEYSTLQAEVRDYEPTIATSDGADGYSFYYRIAEMGKELRKEQKIIAVEIAYNQSQKVQKIFIAAGYHILAVKKDYAGNDRIIIAARK